MTRHQQQQQNRLDAMKQLQGQIAGLGLEMSNDWMFAQQELMRLCQELVDAGDAIPAGIREQARTMLPQLQSMMETSGNIKHKAYNEKVTPIQSDTYAKAV